MRLSAAALHGQHICTLHAFAGMFCCAAVAADVHQYRQMHYMPSQCAVTSYASSPCSCGSSCCAKYHPATDRNFLTGCMCLHCVYDPADTPPGQQQHPRGAQPRPKGKRFVPAPCKEGRNGLFGLLQGTEAGGPDAWLGHPQIDPTKGKRAVSPPTDPKRAANMTALLAQTAPGKVE